MYPYQTPPPQIIVYQPEKNAGVAVLLEVLPGFFLQTFGIGHLYAGNIALGLFFMFGYWAVTFINILLCFVFIGFFTWPLCWIFMMIMSPILASTSVNSANTTARGLYPAPPMYR
jgi:TM2 domain-containing membrane protein YozV